MTRQTTAEGPGLRFAVWSQGCSIRCPGCFNAHLWGARGGTLIEPGRLAEEAVAAAAGGVEGVTLLGGEPFDQAPAFGEFTTRVRRAGLSVMVFSGYEREHLESREAPLGSAALLAATDLLVDGPYRADRPDLRRPWVGSANQRFHFLTDRYRHLEGSIVGAPDRLEVRVSASGLLRLNGWATVEQLDALLDGTRQPPTRTS